jgi:hypothetical protein
MQYWIIYQAGVGGDGFGNLLEHADNVFPADGEEKWRIHYRDGRTGILDRPVRFYQAHWAYHNPMPFRSNSLPETPRLNPHYVELIKQQKNTVITAHPYYFEQVKQFEYKDLVKQHQLLINLYSNRVDRVYQDLVAKRPELLPGLTPRYMRDISLENSKESTRSDYTIHIDIEQAWRDWPYLNSCLEKLGINLDKKYYDHYLTYIDNL